MGTLVPRIAVCGTVAALAWTQNSLFVRDLLLPFAGGLGALKSILNFWGASLSEAKRLTVVASEGRAQS